MPRRIFRRSFNIYIFWIALPFLLAGGVLAAYPTPIMPYVLDVPVAELSPVFYLAVRVLGVTLLYCGITMFVMRREPTRLMDLAFWQGILCLALAGFSGVSPFWFRTSYWVWIGTGYLLIAGFFLLTFSTRNLLVRE